MDTNKDGTAKPFAEANGSAVAACPFCGLTDKDTVSPDLGLVPAVSLHSYPGGYRIECEGCACNGPWHHQSADAIAAWNRRLNVESSATVDELIVQLEARGLGWSMDSTGRLIEARVWDWPNVIGRYRPNVVEPLAKMLTEAMYQVDLKRYPVKSPNVESSATPLNKP